MDHRIGDGLTPVQLFEHILGNALVVVNVVKDMFPLCDGVVLLDIWLEVFVAVKCILQGDFHFVQVLCLNKDAGDALRNNAAIPSLPLRDQVLDEFLGMSFVHHDSGRFDLFGHNLSVRRIVFSGWILIIRDPDVVSRGPVLQL